ncbi:MAG: hypothetical protein Kow00133_18800 [Amphiplicatus sp.]
MNKGFALALFAASAALAAGCASDRSRAARERNPAPCPNVVVLADAARAIEFDGEQTLENIAYTAEILGVDLACRYYADKPIDASLTVDFAFGRGPKGAEREHAFTYFVAVTRKDLEVIEKAEFTVPVEFDDDRPVELAEEKIRKIVIPRAGENTSGTNFEVVVGLALTPEQAIFNRSGKSLKFPNLK